MHSLDLLAQLRTISPELDISGADEASVEALMEEALDLVEGYTRKDFRAQEVLPDPVARVVVRMVSRTLEQDQSGLAIPPNASNLSQTAGAYTRNIGFESGATSGGVWLSRQDRLRLRRWSAGGAATIRMW